MSYENIHFNTTSVFLVTGGAGFIGSNLVETLLKKGYKVRCLDNLSTGKMENIEGFLSNDNFSLLVGDIRDYDTCDKACRGVDYVLHQAAWGSVPRSVENPLVYEEINIKGTLNMLEAAKRNLVKKFVYASSSSVYGDDQRLPKVEGKEGNLLSPYAITKMVNEEYGRIYTTLYGLETYGLRYFNVFGKRQDPKGNYAAVIPKFILQLLNDITPVINGDGNQSRDFTYIENVIEANLKACIAPKKYAGKSYNIACGDRITLNEVYVILSKLLGKNIEPQFTDERVGDIKHSNADITRAKTELGYEPEWNFIDGITQTIEWYKSARL